VVAHGRRGTRVAPRPAVRSRPGSPTTATRTTSAETTPPTTDEAADGIRDLTIGLADPELLPPFDDVLARVSFAPYASVERLGEPDGDLLAYARTWFAADGVPDGAVTVVGGALDGLERVLWAHLRPGDRVLIEDPAYPPIRDLLLALGLTAAPVRVDARGLVPTELERALAEQARALVVVPRAQNPTGAALDAGRAAELRAVLAKHPDLLVVEDDHASLVSGADWHSTIAPERRRWAVVRSVSKLLHPDLRLALLAGDETTVARVEGRLALGPRWVSHLLQGAAVALLTDPGFADRCAFAAGRYAERRRTMASALADVGVTAAEARSGMNLWVPVSEEASVTRGLADAGWRVLAGERFRVAVAPGIRLTISTLRAGEAAQIAAALASAAVPRIGY
jgi:DNA-binding transcriptional MocR family regulator